MMNHIPIIEKQDLLIGKLLGSGGFACVFSASFSKTQLTAQETIPNNFTKDTIRNGSFSTLSSSSSSFRVFKDTVAVKKLHTQTLSCPKLTKIAFHDLHNEVDILANLPNHPHIVHIHGVSDCFFTNPVTAFFLQEKLVVTLDKRIVEWHSEATRGLRNKFVKKHLSKQSQANRIAIAAVGVANALSYLHKNCIIYRDLKPSNIGFDQYDQVRLFDFGLAVRLESSQSTLRGSVGTLRYMAPEVALGQRYTFSTDVYSFGMLVWELCNLEKPFARAKSSSSMMMEVARHDQTPSLKRVASPTIQTLLKECWSSEPSNRPTFDQILAILEPK